MDNILLIERWRMGKVDSEEPHDLFKGIGAHPNLIQMMDYVAIVEDDKSHTVLKSRYPNSRVVVREIDSDFYEKNSCINS